MRNRLPSKEHQNHYKLVSIRLAEEKAAKVASEKALLTLIPNWENTELRDAETQELVQYVQKKYGNADILFLEAKGRYGMPLKDNKAIAKEYYDWKESTKGEEE